MKSEKADRQGLQQAVAMNLDMILSLVSESKENTLTFVSAKGVSTILGI